MPSSGPRRTTSPQAPLDAQPPQPREDVGGASADVLPGDSLTDEDALSIDEVAEQYSERARAAREHQGMSPLVDDQDTLTSLSEFLTTEE